MSSSKSEKKKSGKPRLTRERVLQAAVQLADSQGIAALSMRKLAETLEVEAMSLYNHVANKEEVLHGMVELIMAEIERPEPGKDWQAEIRKRAHSAHIALMRHPWASHLLVSGMNIGPQMLAYVNATLGCLREAGFSYALADRAWNAIDSHIYGFTLQKLNFPLEPSEYAQAASGFLPLLAEADLPYLKALTEMVSTGQHKGLHDFSFGLELLLEGLEKLRLAQTETEDSAL
ncbi:TetR family transcriptional regulator [bacterium (Candidatus Blackallbacteria) CG17_big_fil_post_rev_8_21_14_2_50_48_46]|uniref:TetR family transcriptional regulator n=1 Tax=bacterium (Candidatus Blackallbacteria) CG17_big_fil_post_rev_8_21_14_2_50_48_46 TaxID=2014261 RepID=A0A2M7GB27_9BACT|nr:MAG: TetR family transcriptional regulator [bacterium (Candidatus Blackallbacteria) CG18_big_fil_WC_8_21_14_2_50_49_26]PIW19148.1 MAG: TetR family transcriptional regulator [bacterium (Candidatus Blackallbacteria) CG17_big_fil_post_rev_8_21_14_2_50_48_46]PIW45502.1 MAG: TetR family transcriptional regulator [bacterium (Candidatus Blackallbacteria) CG13_big_fil_rev_8_21_14_2_50_49_14]